MLYIADVYIATRLDPLEALSNARGFEWDAGNATKSLKKHHVTTAECEQVFFNTPVVSDDESHSLTERRYYALGETDSGRRLFLAFTMRDDRIRVISARDMSKRERNIYQDRI